MNNESSIEKEFNTTGTCIPHKHYMSDRVTMIKEVMKLVRKGKYFTINRPRQFGKTTTLYLLEKELAKTGYIPIRLSFEGIDDETLSDVKEFAPAFIGMLCQKLKQVNREAVDWLSHQAEKITSLLKLSDVITELIEKLDQPVVLQIDEVDNAGNNQLFLKFLGMLRSKYLAMNEGNGSTFHSVILAGVRDVKNLKKKITPDGKHEYNSPWNIAVDFKVKLNLSPDEIAEMLTKYTGDQPVSVDIPFFSERLFYLTSGYPFLVSYLCKIIDEELMPGKKTKTWEQGDLDKAIQITLKQNNTNFESLTGKLANNPELYEFVFNIVMNESVFFYNPHNEMIEFGIMHGVLKEENDRVKVHNRLYEQMITNYMASKIKTSDKIRAASVTGNYIQSDGSLDIKKVILKFQQFMKEQYSTKDTDFIERNGRLLFLAFLKPIINGNGYDFKEVQVSEEKRLDIVVTYGKWKFIIELKKWYGEKAHQKGLEQLADYLDRQNRETGFLIIFDSRKKSNRIGEHDTDTIKDRHIFTVWV